MVLIRPHAKGCAFLAREWEYLQACLPENPRFNLSGPEVAPFLPPSPPAEQPPPLRGSSAPLRGSSAPLRGSSAPLSGPLRLPEGWRGAASDSEAQASRGTYANATDWPAAHLIFPAGGASRLLWLLASVATFGGLCFGAGIAVERREMLTRRRTASSSGTAPLLDLPEHIKP